MDGSDQQGKSWLVVDDTFSFSFTIAVVLYTVESRWKKICLFFIPGTLLGCPCFDCKRPSWEGETDEMTPLKKGHRWVPGMHKQTINQTNKETNMYICMDV